MKKTIEDLDLKNKKVIIRVDFNVPIKNGKITDDNRIRESLKTINYACDKGAKVILLSHLGRVKEEKDKLTNTLLPVAKRLEELINRKVTFINETRGLNLENAINELKPGEIVLVENTRFEDLDGKKESSNDPELGSYWASLGDLFINDAFGTSHRAHASNVGIGSNLPNAIGYLVEKEIKIIGNAIKNPDRPFTVVLGGSKVSDKIKVIENLATIADNILIGGGMSYTFLKAKGYNIGSSLLDSENIDFCKDMIKKYGDKIVLPIDTITSKSVEECIDIKEISVEEIQNDDIGVDIGSKTIELFKQYLDSSKTIIWNGPVGVFEINGFDKGTKALLEIIKNNKGTTILGGGDTASAAINFGYKDKFTHISTGGGASLEMLEGKKLPGVSIIEEK